MTAPAQERPSNPECPYCGLGWRRGPGGWPEVVRDDQVWHERCYNMTKQGDAYR